MILKDNEAEVQVSLLSSITKILFPSENKFRYAYGLFQKSQALQAWVFSYIDSCFFLIALQELWVWVDKQWQNEHTLLLQ